MRSHIVLASWLITLGGCVSQDSLMTANGGNLAGGHMTVEAGSLWRKLPLGANQIPWEEVWTWGGPQLDRITFVSGLPDGKAVVIQNEYADQQVPVFRADMTAQDLASMIEVSYRVNGVTAFYLESVEPLDFLGGSGVRLRYHYASGIGIAKRGSCVMRIVDRKLYEMKLESVADQHFDAVASAFDQLVASARLRR
jgi:hypothetical protein